MCNNNGVEISFSLNRDYLAAFRGLPLANTEAHQQLVTFYHNHTEASLAAMPTIASELAAIIGFERMLDFFRNNHNAKVHVKHGCKFFSEIQINQDNAACERIINIADGDGYLYLPSASGIYSSVKRAAVQVAMRSEVNRRDIVRFFGLSNRHVRKMKKIY